MARYRDRCGYSEPAATGSCGQHSPRGTLGQRQHAVERQRERRRWNRAGQDHRRLDHRQPAEDVFAEPAGADRRGNRRGADADDRRDANAGNDRRQRQRQLDPPQTLARCHAKRIGRLDQRGIDGANAGNRGPDDRQQRVDGQHGDRDARAQAANQRHRQQESKHRQARNRLTDVGQPDERRAHAHVARGKHAGGNAGQHGNERRDADERQVLTEQEAELRQMRPPELEHAHESPRNAAPASTSGASSAWTIGSG